MNGKTRQRWHHRWHAAHGRWKHSIKWRLVTAFVVLACLSTMVFVWGTQRALQAVWGGYAQPLLADYVDRLAAEIGNPPSAEKARALAARLPITVRIEGPVLQFDSHPGERPFPRFGGRNEHEFMANGWMPMRETADGHRIRFGLAALAPSARPRMFGTLTLVTLLLMTWLAYAYVRKLLRPLGPIADGVSRFGAGDFSQPIPPPRHHDELGDLAQRINRMADGLRGMLDAKRALLLAISHELRSPLTRARINAELVPSGEHRDALLRDLAEMRHLIEDLLESERLAQGHGALQTERVDLAALVRETLAIHFPGRALTLAIDDSLAPVTADPMRLRLALRNLVENALRHAPGAQQPPIVTLAQRDNGWLSLAVRDHGPGVSEEQLAQLSEPFYRADPARQRATGGVGLGLTLCRLVAQAHGGRLEFRRAEPGLEVWITWPGGA